MKISTITPVYNNESFLDECILSLLNQTYLDSEFIFIDDGSSDRSSEILRKYEHNSNIKVIYKQENKGIAAAYQDAIRIASGDVLALLDADDVSMPDRLALTAEEFIRDEDLGIVYSKMDLIDGKGKSFDLSLCLPRYLNNKNLFMQLFRRGFFTGSGMSIRNVPALKTNLDIICCDYYFSLQLADQGFHFSYIDKSLTKYRIHKGNTSSQSTRLLSDLVKAQSPYSYSYLFDKWQTLGHSLIEIYTTFGINSYYFHKDLELAEQYFDRVIGLGGNLESYFYLGNISFSLGKVEKAYKYFKFAYEIAPEHFQTVHNFGILKEVYDRKNNEATDLLQKAKKMQPYYNLISKNIHYLNSGEISALKLIHFLSDEDAVINSYCRMIVN